VRYRSESNSCQLMTASSLALSFYGPSVGFVAPLGDWFTIPA